MTGRPAADHPGQRWRSTADGWFALRELGTQPTRVRARSVSTSSLLATIEDVRGGQVADKENGRRCFRGKPQRQLDVLARTAPASQRSEFRLALVAGRSSAAQHRITTDMFPRWMSDSSSICQRSARSARTGGSSSSQASIVDPNRRLRRRRSSSSSSGARGVVIDRRVLPGASHGARADRRRSSCSTEVRA